MFIVDSPLRRDQSLARRSSLLFNRLTLLSLASFSFNPFDGETFKPTELDVDVDDRGTAEESNGPTDKDVVVVGGIVVLVGTADGLGLALAAGANLADETNLLMKGS